MNYGKGPSDTPTVPRAAYDGYDEFDKEFFTGLLKMYVECLKFLTELYMVSVSIINRLL